MPTSPLPNWAVSLSPEGFIAVVSVLLLSLPQAARNAARAVEPPPAARKRRLDWGPASCLISAIGGRLLVVCLLTPTGRAARVDQNLRMTAGGRTRGAGLLALGSIVSVQSGAALATGLFDSVGTAGAVFLRAGFGAIALLL